MLFALSTIPFLYYVRMWMPNEARGIEAPNLNVCWHSLQQFWASALCRWTCREVNNIIKHYVHIFILTYCSYVSKLKENLLILLKLIMTVLSFDISLWKHLNRCTLYTFHIPSSGYCISYSYTGSNNSSTVFLYVMVTSLLIWLSSLWIHFALLPETLLLLEFIKDLTEF